MRRIAIALICAFLSLESCGYHWAKNDCARSICVPYVVGDQDGMLSSALIRECCNASDLRVSSDAPYRLKVAIVQDSVDPLGYRLDRQKIDHHIRKHLTQNEERRTILVDVTLEDRLDDHPIMGPFRLSAYEDYDYVDGDALADLQFHNASGEKVIVLPFSLGQLESQESAHAAAEVPLYHKISQKIVDVIRADWSE